MPHRVNLQFATIAFLAVVAISPGTRAASDIWDNTPSGNWENGANWVDGSTPGVNDTATFNLAQIYSVTFVTDPAVIQALSATAGTVTLRSSGGARTLSLAAGAGSQDLIVNGVSTTVALGVASNPLHLNAGDDLSIQNGGTLAILFNSDVVANDLSDSGLNGTLRVDGAGSTLTLTGAIANLIGASAGGSLILQNGATGNSINGSLALANSATQGVSGSLSILSGSSLALGGNLTLANQNLAGQVASITINGANSALTQSGASTVTIGSATNGTGTINIGTTATGGSLATGTGLFTINKSGTVTIGSGTNTGSLLVGGDLTINGGVLQKSSAASTLDLAAGKTVAIQGGGRLTHVGSFAFDSNQVVNVTGTGSKLEITGTSTLAIRDEAQVNLSSGAAISAAGKIDIGTVGSGLLSVAGTSSTATGGSELNIWASGGGTANVTISDKAIGTFNAGIDLANSTAAGTTALVNVLTGAVLNTGNLNLAGAGGATTSATINIHGTDSRIVQSSTATLTVGHASEGAATINIGTTTAGGGLTTGGGLVRINKTGIVHVGSGANGGTLEVLGNIMVDGGRLEEGSDNSTFAWATGKTLTIQNGGRVHFASSYLTAASSQHIITGTDSRFEVVGAVNLRGAAQIGASSGGAISAGELHVGGGGTAGSLIVDGLGTTASVAGEENLWGSGGAATVTLSNQAAATITGSLHLADSAATLVNVHSGADLATGNLSLAAIGGTATATLNVLGVGSTVSLSPDSDLVIGHANNGVATINLDDGGSLGVGTGGSTTINATGTVNIAAGTADLRALTIVGGAINITGGTLAFTSLGVNGGAIHFNSGRIEQTNNLAADEALLTTLLGPTHVVTSGRTLAAGAGAANVSTKLDLNGGRLEGNSLSVTNSGPTVTELRIRNGGVAQFTGGASLATGTTTFVDDGGTLIAGGQIIQASELQLTGTARLAGTALANSGLLAGSGRIDANLQNLSTGQIRLATSERLSLRGGGHQSNGLIDIDGGELEVATGSFTNGTANPATATIAARRASLRFTGGLTNAGSIVCSEGTSSIFGNVTNVGGTPTTGRIVVTAAAQATFYGNVVNQGTIQVSAAGAVTSTALFLGSLSGNGVNGSGSVFLEGDVRPGTTIGTMAFGGDVSIGSAAVVTMELSGTVAGSQFDRIVAQQSLAMGGTLAVALAAGFTPAAGQSFDLFDWGTRSGTFAAINLPTLAGLAWNTSQLYTTGVVSVSAGITGDFNGDGTVDAADYTVWRNGLGTLYTQSHYTLWKSHFGESSGGGAVAADGRPAPEPATMYFLVAATAILAGAARWRASVR